MLKAPWVQISIDVLDLDKGMRLASMAEEAGAVLSLFASGRLDPMPLVTHTFPLEAAQKAFETAADPGAKAIKVLIIP